MENENIMETEALQQEVEQAADTDTKKKSCEDLFLQKCDEVYQAWSETAKRLKDDLDACGYNPYIRETTIHKVEIFRSPKDNTPIDTFETKKTQGISLCSLLMAGGVALILSCCAPKKFKFLK